MVLNNLYISLYIIFIVILRYFVLSQIWHYAEILYKIERMIKKRNKTVNQDKEGYENLKERLNYNYLSFSYKSHVSFICIYKCKIIIN